VLAEFAKRGFAEAKLIGKVTTGAPRLNVL
jgi:hypothetical protein